MRAYELDPQPKPAIATLIKNAVAHWKFAPVLDADKPGIARTQMRLEVRATPSADGFSVRIQRVVFGQPLKTVDAPRPAYPAQAVGARVDARVLVALQIDASGKVVNAKAVQTSLSATTRNEYVADEWRRVFERTSVATARKWTFDLSETPMSRAASTTALPPIQFTGRQDDDWKAFVSGPIHSIPWREAQDRSMSRSCAMARPLRSIRISSSRAT